MEPSVLERFSWLEENFTDPTTELYQLPRDELLNLAIQVLHIPVNERREIHELTLKCALSGVNFFAKVITEQGERVFDQCLSRLTHQKIPVGQAVCNVGDPGSTFYVVMKGDLSVSVLVQKVVEIKATKKAKARRMIRYEFQEVSILQPGSSFGELALIHDTPRTATVRAMEQVELAVLSRDAFKEILAKHTLWKINRDIGFFSTLPIFSKSSKRAISTLIYHFDLVKLPRNAIVFKENEESDRLYFIKSGEVKISKAIYTKQEGELDELKGPKLNKKVFELAILGPKEIFGAEELYTQTKRETSAVVNSNEAEIYYISKKDFEVRLAETEEFVLYFTDYCKKKVESRAERIKMIMENVPMQSTVNSPNKSLLKKRNVTPQPGRKKSPNGANQRDQSPLQEGRVKTRGTSNPRPIKAYTEGKEMNLSPALFTPLNPLASRNQNSPELPTKTHDQIVEKSVNLTQQLDNIKRHTVHQIETDGLRSKTQNPLELNTTRLFENKVFEQNRPKTRHIHHHPVPNERKRTETQDPSSRSYLSSRWIEPKGEFDYQKIVIEAQSKILSDKLRGQNPLNEDALYIDLFQQTPLKRRVAPVLNQIQRMNFDLFDRYKNLPIFQTEITKQVKDPYEVKNIHVQAKKMAHNDSFSTQSKIYHRVRLSTSQGVSRVHSKSRGTQLGSQDQLTFVDITHGGSHLVLNQRSVNSSVLDDEMFPSRPQTKFGSQSNTRKNSLKKILDSGIFTKT